MGRLQKRVGLARAHSRCCMCQGKVESSAFQQSRKFRFRMAVETTHGKLEQPRQGRAWRGAQGRCDGDGSEEIGTGTL